VVLLLLGTGLKHVWEVHRVDLLKKLDYPFEVLEHVDSLNELIIACFLGNLH
jgi:hypothetical protein